MKDKFNLGFKPIGPEDEEYWDCEEEEFDENEDEYGDPSLGARCSDWEDAPNSCALCGDDECPLNRG